MHEPFVLPGSLCETPEYLPRQEYLSPQQACRVLLLILALTAPALQAQEGPGNGADPVGDQKECSAPPRPGLPDGASADYDAMLAGQQAVRAFQTANMGYMQCLESVFSAAKNRAAKAETTDEKALAQGAYEQATDAYNAAVSAEEEVAGRFNIELREYRATQR